jgi:hypothetical protein
LFDCAYAKAPSAVRAQFEAAAPHLSPVGLASAPVPQLPLREATINVVDGLLLLLEQALLQVCAIIFKSTQNTPDPPALLVPDMDVMRAASARSHVGRTPQASILLLHCTPKSNYHVRYEMRPLPAPGMIIL